MVTTIKMAEISEAATLNPYLMGRYAPVENEIETVNLEVIGEIPRDLHGVYVRNGPNPRYAAKGRYHWFDGDGMLHAVMIQDGKISYRNRYVRTKAFEQEDVAGSSLWSGIMEPRSNNPKDAPLKDTANTDIIFYNGNLLSLWYMAGKPYRVDARSLETKEIEDFGGQLPGNMSAHAKVDEVTGELLWFDYSPKPPYMYYGVASADGKLKHYIPVELPGMRSPHDMAITQNYSILMDLPFFADQEALKQGRTKVRLHREIPSRFAIVPRYGAAKDIRWFEAESCYIYHTINAWEEGDEIIMDGCQVVQPEPYGGGNELERMLSYLRLHARLYRWRFNLKTGKTTEYALDEENTEFPTMNMKMLGRPTRYAYNVHIPEARTLLFDGIVKYDTITGKSQTHWFGEDRYGSEAPFAPRQNASGEDDGYLLTFVHDDKSETSELLIIDAQDMLSAPVARVKLPQRVPMGFHACWVPGEKLAS